MARINYYFSVNHYSTHPEDVVRAGRRFYDLTTARREARIRNMRVYKVKLYPDSGDIEYVEDVTIPKKRKKKTPFGL